jgi:two-component system sensor histidine kinase UhpB
MPDVQVLIIEDSVQDFELIGRELRRGGFDPGMNRVDTTQELDDALARGGWDIVLSDYRLPTLTGLEALRAVRERDSDLPFILVSGAVGEETAVDAMRAGAQDYVMKNNLARLGQVVRREIADAQSRRERKRVERALVESEERLRMVVQATRDAIYDRDVAANRSWFNEACARLLGPFGPEDDLHNRWVERLHPDDRLRVLAHFADAWKTGGSQGIEYRVRRGNSEYAYVLDRCFVQTESDGRPVRMIGAMMDITERKNIEHELREVNQKLKHLSARVLSVQEDERRFIARELHDDVGQVLTALKIGLDTLAKAGPPTVAGVPVDELADMANRALTGVRDITLSLRPPQLDDLGLAAALRWHLDQQSKVSGWIGVFDADALPQRLESNLETACFRVFQEALTNAARHAKASRVEVSLRVIDNRLRVSVIDDGEGFDPLEVRQRLMRGTSVGLAGMEERVVVAKGQLEISSGLGRGTAINAEFPLIFR